MTFKEIRDRINGEVKKGNTRIDRGCFYITISASKVLRPLTVLLCAYGKKPCAIMLFRSRAVTFYFQGTENPEIDFSCHFQFGLEKDTDILLFPFLIAMCPAARTAHACLAHIFEEEWEE